MRLYFFRHGPAASRAEWTGEDAQRALTDDGAALTRDAAKAMGPLRLGVTSILTSPYVRAYDTAVIAAEELHLEDALVTDARLAPGFDEDGLRSLLAGRTEEERLMLVGHEPDFTGTISAIIGGGHIKLKKAGLARVDIQGVDDLSGELIWLVPPKLLAR